MKGFARTISVALGGLAAAAALAGTAHAADPTYFSIIQQEGTKPYALKAWPSGAITRTSLQFAGGGVPSSQRWFKRNDANTIASYENVKYPGQCLEVRDNHAGTALTTGPCQTFLARQKWTQGFSSATFRKFENMDSHQIASYKLASPGQPSVTQQTDQGLPGQLWQVKQTFRGPYVK